MKKRNEIANQSPKSKETRKRILDSAASLFRRYGPSVRLEDVAKAAGIKTGSLYYHFDSRDALIEEVLRLSVTFAVDHLEETLAKLPTSTTELERLEAGIHAIAEIALVLNDYSAAENRLFPAASGDLRKRQSAREKKLGNMIQRLIESADEAGYLRPGLDLYTVRAIIFGAINWTSEWYRPNREPSAKTVTEHIVEMTLFGISAKRD